MLQNYNCCTVERQLRQIVLDYTTKINNLICIVNKQQAQIKLDCITCSNGSTVLPNLKNSFALATDSTGKIITATNVYTKEEIDNLIESDSINIGNSDLTLTDNRILEGDGKSLNFDDISILEINSNSFNVNSVNSIHFVTEDTFTIKTNGPIDLLSGEGFALRTYNNTVPVIIKTQNITEQRNLEVPDESGTIALDKYSVFRLTSDGDGILQSPLLEGKYIGLIHGASIFYEEDYQFYKPINGDTILDKATEGDPTPSPYIFLPNQKYYLTPIKP